MVRLIERRFASPSDRFRYRAGPIRSQPSDKAPQYLQHRSRNQRIDNRAGASAGQVAPARSAYHPVAGKPHTREASRLLPR